MNPAPDDPVVLAGMARTPIGAFQGALKNCSAPQLGSAAIGAAVARAGIALDSVDTVLMGCVLSAGLGQAPARQAALGAGLPQATPAVTINKMCGSGLQAVAMARDAIAAGSAACVVAGGMESMTNAPYLLDRARAGYRFGHGRILDHMLLDGLEDAYEPGRPMGSFAEDCAAAFGFSRMMQDAYAHTSLERAMAAIASGAFADEIVPVAGLTQDEQPAKARPDRIASLKPVFRDDGTITAANASSISDGAAALVLLRQSDAAQRGLPVLATVCGYAVHAQAPAAFATAPAGAIARLLDRLGWTVADVDLWEVNEAFAVVTMAAIQTLALPPDRVNIHGGACALGHPIGASGARVLVTLVAALHRHSLRRGIAALCIGGGEAIAMAVERPT